MDLCVYGVYLGARAHKSAEVTTHVRVNATSWEKEFFLDN